MNLGKLIRLFLVEGNPDGIVTAEIQNMTIYATSFPRTKINVFKKREEAKKAGTYILIGDNLENPMKPIVYVGEGAPVFDRIQTHNGSKYKKDFWDRAIVFSSKDDYLTKTQVKSIILCKILCNAFTFFNQLFELISLTEKSYIQTSSVRKNVTILISRMIQNIFSCGTEPFFTFIH